MTGKTNNNLVIITDKCLL